MAPERRGGWWPEHEDGEGKRPERAAEPGDPEPDAPSASGGSPPKPPHGLESRERPKVASRYSLFVGLAFLALIVVAIVNVTDSEEGGILGADDRAGMPVAEFAVPDALSGNEADANVFQDDCESARNPCPEDEVRDPACEIDDPDAIRVCDFFDKPLAISFWFTRGGDCLPTQDAFDAVARRRGEEVNFLSINILDDAESVAGIVRENRWSVPVGHDADGAVSNLFGVGVCPTILLAYPGGIIADAEIRPGNYDEAAIDEMVDGLLEMSRAREPGSR